MPIFSLVEEFLIHIPLRACAFGFCLLLVRHCLWQRSDLLITGFGNAPLSLVWQFTRWSISHRLKKGEREFRGEIRMLQPFEIKLRLRVSESDKLQLTSWIMEPGGSIPNSQGLFENPYPETNQSYFSLIYSLRSGTTVLVEPCRTLYQGFLSSTSFLPLFKSIFLKSHLLPSIHFLRGLPQFILSSRFLSSPPIGWLSFNGQLLYPEWKKVGVISKF